jgi:hypothetical protein
MRMNYWMVGAASAAALLAPQASASTVTQTVSFTASDFTSFASTTPPVDPVKGTVTFTLDPTLDYTNDAADISLSFLNIALSSAVEFNYNSLTHSLIFGGSDVGASAATFGTNDFYLRFTIDDLATGNSFFYAQSGVIDGYMAHQLTLQAGPFATTPLPGSVSMLLTALVALVGVGFARARWASGVTLLKAAGEY